MRGRKRLLSRPVNKKEPITVDILEKIVDLYGTNLQNVSDLRICILCLMGFSGFCRCSELAEIRLRNLVFKEKVLPSLLLKRGINYVL